MRGPAAAKHLSRKRLWTRVTRTLSLWGSEQNFLRRDECDQPDSTRHLHCQLHVPLNEKLNETVSQKTNRSQQFWCTTSSVNLTAFRPINLHISPVIRGGPHYPEKCEEVAFFDNTFSYVLVIIQLSLNTRNLAIANRSRVSSRHTVTTVNFRAEKFFTERKHMGWWDTGGGDRCWKHKFQCGIVFHGSRKENICDTVANLVAATEATGSQSLKGLHGLPVSHCLGGDDAFWFLVSSFFIANIEVCQQPTHCPLIPHKHSQPSLPDLPVCF